MPVIEAELVRCPHDPAAMDGKRAVKSAPAAAPRTTAAPAGAASTAPNALSMTMAVSASVDGLPREDISALLTPKLIKEVGSPDWKVRLLSHLLVNMQLFMRASRRFAKRHWTPLRRSSTKQAGVSHPTSGPTLPTA